MPSINRSDILFIVTLPDPVLMGTYSLTAREPVFNEKRVSVLVIRSNKTSALKYDMEFLKYCYVNIFLEGKIELFNAKFRSQDLH